MNDESENLVIIKKSNGNKTILRSFRNSVAKLIINIESILQNKKYAREI